MPILNFANANAELEPSPWACAVGSIRDNTLQKPFAIVLDLIFEHLYDFVYDFLMEKQTSNQAIVVP